MRIQFIIGTLVLILFSNFLNAQSITKPEVLKFGDTKSNIMLALNDMCKIVTDKKIDPTQLPTAKTSQSQLDCEKFQYAGKKRKMEVVFADGILDLAWILIEPEEEDTLIAGFTALYGKPTHVKDDVTFFLNDGVAVRNDPHEVLFISDRLKASYKVWLEKKDK
jgi:hypothetical protein